MFIINKCWHWYLSKETRQLLKFSPIGIVSGNQKSMLHKTPWKKSIKSEANRRPNLIRKITVPRLILKFQNMIITGYSKCVSNLQPTKEQQAFGSVHRFRGHARNQQLHPQYHEWREREKLPWRLCLCWQQRMQFRTIDSLVTFLRELG